MNWTFVYESGANKGFNMGGSKGTGGVPCLGIFYSQGGGGGGYNQNI